MLVFCTFSNLTAALRQVKPYFLFDELSLRSAHQVSTFICFLLELHLAKLSSEKILSNDFVFHCIHCEISINLEIGLSYLLGAT